MPTYVYETIPRSADQAPCRFELRQSMTEAALKVHPETGEPVRRVVSGGLGYLRTGGASPSSVQDERAMVGAVAPDHSAAIRLSLVSLRLLRELT